MKRETKYRFFLVAIILVQCLIIVFWGTQKQAFFWDEYHSLEGAKAEGKACFNQWDDADDFYEIWHTRDEFMEAVTVSEDELFINNPFDNFVEAVKENNIYYTILNLCYSFCGDRFSIWPPIGFNIFMLILSDILIYFIAKKIMGNSENAILPVIFYGFSAGAISTAIYMRTYMLGGTLVLLFLYIQIVYLFQKKMGWRLLCFISQLPLLYISYRIHFVVMVFNLIVLLSFFVAAIVLNKGEYLKLQLILLLSSMFLFFTVVIKYMHSYMTSGIGVDVYSNIVAPNIRESMYTFAMIVSKFIYHHLFYSPFLISLIAFICILVYLSVAFYKRNKITDNIVVCITCSSAIVLYLLVYSFIFKSWYSSADWRFISICYSIIVISIICYACILLDKVAIHKKTLKRLAVFAFLLIIASSYNSSCISMLYTDTIECRNIISSDEYKNLNGICLNTTYEAAYLWSDEPKNLIKNDLDEVVLSMNEIEDNRVLLWITGSLANESTLNYLYDETGFSFEKELFSYDDGYDGIVVYEVKR